MIYHLLLETDEGYVLVKQYKRWASKAMMAFLVHQVWEKPGQKVWIIAAKPNTLENFFSIGMPNGYCWTDMGWQERTMPVKKLLKKGGAR